MEDVGVYDNALAREVSIELQDRDIELYGLLKRIMSNLATRKQRSDAWFQACEMARDPEAIRHAAIIMDAVFADGFVVGDWIDLLRDHLQGEATPAGENRMAPRGIEAFRATLLEHGFVVAVREADDPRTAAALVRWFVADADRLDELHFDVFGAKTLSAHWERCRIAVHGPGREKPKDEVTRRSNGKGGRRPARRD